MTFRFRIYYPPLQISMSTAADFYVHRCRFLCSPLQDSVLTAADSNMDRCKFVQQPPSFDTHRCRLNTIRCNISLLYLCALDPTQSGLRPRELVNV